MRGYHLFNLALALGVIWLWVALAFEGLTSWQFTALVVVVEGCVAVTAAYIIVSGDD